MFHLVIVNLVVTLLGAAGFFLTRYLHTLNMGDGLNQIVTFLGFTLMMVLVSVGFFAEGDNTASIANFEVPKLKKYFANIVHVLKDGILFGLFISFLTAIAFISIPYYFRMWIPADGSKGSFVGILLLSLVFWFLVITILSLQWFLPIRNLMHNKFLKCLKKSYILFFDNAGFTILMALNNLFLLAITVFTLGLIPGVNGITLANTNALRIRLYKYDWYEVNPGMTKEQRSEVPWADLIAKDKRILGPRKFKSFLFPWKE